LRGDGVASIPWFAENKALEQYSCFETGIFKASYEETLYRPDIV
jgi:hypothetical protein